MKKQIITFMAFLLSASSMAQTTITVEVKNPTKIDIQDYPIVVNLKKYGEVEKALVMDKKNNVVSQLDDMNGDGVNDELCFLTDLKGKQKKKFEITLNTTEQVPEYKARTFAELVLRNPKVKEKNKQDIYLKEIQMTDEVKDQYHVMHHHGVAFENELIAMRIYFDKRQTLDLYGKKHKGLELKETQFYTSEDQKAKGYGDDILWVGNTFGFGAFRGWDGQQPTMIDDVKVRVQRVVSMGPVRTIVEMEDKGWKVNEGQPRINATIRYTLYAGHRDLLCDVFLGKKNKEEMFSTGLINVKNSTEYTDGTGLRGLWGADYPTTDGKSKLEAVGMGICIPERYIVQEEPANQDNYGFVITPVDNHIQYRLTYGSDNEDFGYHNSQDWFNYLKQWRRQLTVLPEVKIL